MAQRPKNNQTPYRLVTLIEHDLLAKIDAQAKRQGFGTTRSDIVRNILRRALLGAQQDRDSGVRAAG